MPQCIAPNCTKDAIKTTDNRKHRYCQTHRDELLTQLNSTFNTIKAEVIAMRQQARAAQLDNWQNINAGDNSYWGFQTTLGGTYNPIKVEKEVWYVKSTKLHPSRSGVVAAHFGDNVSQANTTIIIHIQSK